MFSNNLFIAQLIFFSRYYMSKYYPANRIVQIDSKLLDNDLIKSFQSQFDDVFANLFYNNKFLIYKNELKKHLSVFYYLTQMLSGIKLKIIKFYICKS